MIYFDKDCEPANDIVVLKIVDTDTLSSKSSGFVVGDEELRNMRVGLYQILKIGKYAKEQTGLEVGAYVFADKLASFYHTEPICLMRYNALIMETNEEKNKYRALGGRCIVQPVKEDDSDKQLFVVQNTNEMKIGVIKSITPPYDKTKQDNASEFKVGDKILLTKEDCDVLHGFTGDKSLDPSLPIYIYKTESIICRLNQ
mgnify:CR=1 FL=1